MRARTRPLKSYSPAITSQGVLNTHSYYPDAYRLSDLEALLSDFVKRRPQRGYNEIVISSARWEQQLPFTFEAFFYPRTSACTADPMCEGATRTAHARFVAEFPESGMPLLTLDPSDWQAPFAEAPPAAAGPRVKVAPTA